MRRTELRTSVVVVMLLLSALLGADCRGSGAEQDFLSLPPARRQQDLLTRPLEQQVELYILAMKAEHPRDFGLRDALDSNGRPLVPLIASRLRRENGERVKLYLIEVLGRMSSGGYFDVKSDPDTVKLVESEIDGMQDPVTRSMALASLNKILAHDQQR